MAGLIFFLVVWGTSRPSGCVIIMSKKETIYVIPTPTLSVDIWHVNTRSFVQGKHMKTPQSRFELCI